MSAFKRQEGGQHYRNLAIQPVEFIHRNGLGFCEGNAVKYLTRWRAKGGVEDLRKARHYIDLLIELETRIEPEPDAIEEHESAAPVSAAWLRR